MPNSSPEVTRAVAINQLRQRTPDLPTPQEVQLFTNAGYEVDQHGRPLHPWRHTRLAEVELVEGKGPKLRHWGPNYAVDPVVIVPGPEPKVLLIHRGSKEGQLALPGGFLDPEETNPEYAARRELSEETGLTFDAEGLPFFYGVVDDPRTSLHAWIESFAYVFTVPEAYPLLQTEETDEKGGAHNPEWVDATRALDTLYGSHAELIRRALEHVAQLDS